MRSLKRLIPVFLLVALSRGAFGQTPSDDEQLLRERGLTRVGTGQLWEFKSEPRLRSHFSRLAPLRSKILEQQRQLATKIRENRERWLTRRNKPDAKKSVGESRQEKREKPVGASTVVSPERIGQRPDILARVARLNALRNALALSLLDIRAELEPLPDDYRRLAGDAAAQSALLRLGHRLAAANRYRAETRALDDYHRVVFTPWTPLYQLNQEFRISGLVNDRAPATFTWRREDSPTLITHNVVESAGVAVRRASKTTSLRIGRRTLNVVETKIDRLRFAACDLRDVKVLALPPEGEDLGCRIGVTAFRGYRVEPQPDRLRLILAPATSVGRSAGGIDGAAVSEILTALGQPRRFRLSQRVKVKAR